VHTSHPLFILLFFISFCSASFAANKPLIFSIAPSYPVPIAELETLEKPSKWKRPGAKLNKKPILLASSPKLTVDLPSRKQAWTAVIEYLEKQTNLPIKFEPPSSQLDFELKLSRGYYDLAYVTPIQFNAFRDFPGYQAQIKRKAQPLRGIIFVKKSSNITTFSQLRESTIAFPGALNFAASVIPRESLSRLKFNITPKFLEDSDQVYAGVASKKYIAGAGTEESLKAQEPEIRDTLKIIWNSPGFSPHALIAHPRVPFYPLIKLKKAMVGMIKDPNGKELLKHIFVNNGFEVAKGSDWDEIKNINLDTLNNSPTL